MIYTKCGSYIAENSSSCSKCEINTNKKESINIIDKLKNFFRQHIKFGPICAILIIISIMLLIVATSQLKREIRNNKSTEAFRIYNEKIKGSKDGELEIINLLKADTNNIKISFAENKLEYNAAISKLSNIDDLGLVSEDIKKSKNSIIQLNN